MLTMLFWLLCMPGITAKLVYENVEIDGFTYDLYDEVSFYDGDDIHLVGSLKAMSDYRYAEFRESYHLSLPSTIKYEGEEYLVAPERKFFEQRDFKDMEIITFGGYSLEHLHDFPHLKRIIMVGEYVIGFNVGMRNLPSLQELELSVTPGAWDEKRGKIMYPQIRNSFLNVGCERLRFSEESVVGWVMDSFYDLPNVIELTLCSMESCRDSFWNLPKLRELTFEKVPESCYSSFRDLPMLKKITLKKWNNRGAVGFSNSFTEAPLLKDIYVEEPLPCPAYFGYDSNYDADFYLPYGFFYPPHVTLHVPVGSRELYAAAEGWKDFGEIVEYDPAGIEAPEADASRELWSCAPTAGGVTVSAGSDVAVDVMSPSGSVVRRVVVCAGDAVTVELPAGIYIVAGSGQSAKVCVR